MADEKPEAHATLEDEAGEAEQSETTQATEAEPDSPSGEQSEAGESVEESTDLEAELEAAKDSALRAQADAMNVQRRAEQEIEKARKFALERFCSDLLSVVDNLERALESSGDEQGNAALTEGIELTRKGFMDVLGKYGVESVDPMGEPYNPDTAQAMSMVEQPDVEPNSVVAVMQKGYTLNGRLLRPAMVMVSKALSGD
ncbi:MAG: nucleotide exchange factor GrpE [Halieaceae bacterium]|nr:nucleotide exchange factor GrpE [Halieaceae bacterium]